MQVEMVVRDKVSHRPKAGFGGVILRVYAKETSVDFFTGIIALCAKEFPNAQVKAYDHGKYFDLVQPKGGKNTR